MNRYKGKKGARHWFLDLPVGKKLLLVYLGGIFVPLVLITSYFTIGLLREAQRQEANHLTTTMDSLVSALENHLQSFSLISQAIVGDTVIYRLLVEDYSETGDYQEAHSQYLRPALLKYTAGFTGVRNIVIYVDNETIGISSGYVTMTDQHRSSHWYLELNKNPLTPLVLLHHEEDFRMGNNRSPYLSLFRYMSSPVFQSNDELILRVDVQIPPLLSIISEAPLLGELVLEDYQGNRILQWRSSQPPASGDYLQKVSRKVKWGTGLNITGAVASLGPSVGNRFSFVSYFGVFWLSVSLTLAFIFLLNSAVTSRILLLNRHLKKVEREDFSPITLPHFGHDEIGNLLHDFNLMADRINHLINRVYRQDLEHKKLEITRKQAELDNLQSQINPHFLNNVLESIRMRSVIKDEEETAKVILKLSRLFRRMITWEHDLIPLEQEIAFTSEYMEIQKYRYEDKIDYQLRTSFRSHYWSLPRITIQGIVENACMHGLENITEKGELKINIYEEDQNLVIEVQDNGRGFDIAHEPEGIGLSNIKERLRLYYRDKGSIFIDSSPHKGTFVKIIIPPGVVQYES